MSCLFDSLSFFVKRPSSEIRNEICDYLEKDPLLMDDVLASKIIEVESGKTLQEYVALMRHTSTQGGAIEINVFIKLWKLSVFVFSQPTHRWIEFINPDDPTNIIRLVWFGNHYAPITN
jgi:hypothetical protein